MKNIILSTLTILLAASSVMAGPFRSKGTIGTYKIEGELNLTQNAEMPIRGRYNYQGKTSYLDLQGELAGGNVLYLEESYKGEITGRFYLTSEEGHISGKWIGTKSWHEVELSTVSGQLSDLESYSLDDFNAQTNGNITGSYADEIYFVNDMWFTEDEPNLEVGFNGGVVIAEERGMDSLHVHFNLICGPTYHFAYFDGVAWKTEKGKYEFSGELGGDEPCKLIFEFSPGKVSITQESASFDCGFGARAYAEGTFMKVNDKVVKGEDLGISDVLPR